MRQALRAPGRQGLILLSLVLVCGGASLNSGGYSPVALSCELIAILLLALACSAEDRPLGRWSWFAGVGALSVCDLLYTLGWSLLEAVFAGLALASVVLVARAQPARLRLAVAVALAAAAATGTVILGFHSGVGDHIDVLQQLQKSANALLHGRNPYGPLTPVRISFNPQTRWLNLVFEHFSYLPVSALVAVPGALLGDARYSTVAVALVIGAATLALWRSADHRLRPRAEHALLLAVLFPLLPGMIVFAWVDLEIVAGIAIWLALRERSRVLAVLALSLGMCVKPTACILLLPLALRSRRHAAEVVVALAGAAALALAFALPTGIGTFVYAVLGVQFKYSTRPNSLALATPLYFDGLHPFPYVIAAAALLLAAVHVVRHRPHSLGEALTGAALIGLVSCVFNAFAYFNYYVPVASLIVLALMAPRRGVEPGTDAASPPSREPAASAASPGAPVR